MKSRVYIKYVEEWDEYQVRVTGRPEATYYTDDPDDARATAEAMRRELARVKE